jgi:hypothetical protein
VITGLTGQAPPPHLFGHYPNMGPKRPPVFTNRLQCVECGRVSREGERGWTARLTVDKGEPAEAVVYCPECDEREFGTCPTPKCGGPSVRG